MTDILIRGMDKPHNCFQCDLSYLRGERLFCHVTKDEVLRSKIPSDCPIQELPEHGDLIDLDAVVNCQYYDDMYEEWSIRTVTVRDVLYGCLEAMPPVVIPSNKEETE